MPRAHKTSWYREHPLLPFEDRLRESPFCCMCGVEMSFSNSNKSACKRCSPHVKFRKIFWNARNAAKLYFRRDLPLVLSDVDKLNVNQLSNIIFAYTIIEEDWHILRIVCEKIKGTTKIGSREINNFLSAIKKSRVQEAAEKLLLCAIKYQRAVNNIEEKFDINESIPETTDPELYYHELREEQRQYVNRLFAYNSDAH